QDIQYKRGDRLRQRYRVLLRGIKVAARQHVVDHALQAHALAVLRRVDPRDAVVLQFLDLGGDDDAAAAAEYLHPRPASAAQQVDHVLEVLDVPALVRRHGDAL